VRTLNRAGGEFLAALAPDVHACTDTTGFGLIFHSTERAVASGTTLIIAAPNLPILPGALELAATSRSGGLTSNREHFGPGVKADGIPADVLDVCYDPQTSGGLLAAVDQENVDEVLARLQSRQITAAVVGRVVPETAHRVAIVTR
jgi:selenide,water dikinase